MKKFFAIAAVVAIAAILVLVMLIFFTDVFKKSEPNYDDLYEEEVTDYVEVDPNYVPPEPYVDEDKLEEERQMEILLQIKEELRALKESTGNSD